MKPISDRIFRKVSKDILQSDQTLTPLVKHYVLQFKGSANTHPLVLPFEYDPFSANLEGIVDICDHLWLRITLEKMNPVIFQCQLCKGKATFHVWEGV